MFGGAAALVGDFTGYRDAGIRYRFRFCSDGVYFYLAERADDEYVLWQLAHRGRWELARGADPRQRDKSAAVLQLQPEYMDIRPKEREAVPLLRERALPTDRVEKYLISAYESRDRERKRTYCCSVPDPSGGRYEKTWHLEWAASEVMR
jgi:hypothetical protein